MPVMAVTKFERFFRIAAGLDVDKRDITRYSDFVNDKVYDLLVRGQATAKANIRDVVEPHDLPITAGLQQSMHAFRDLDEEIELQPILDDLATRRPIEATLSEEAEAQLPEIVGGLSVALARTLTLVDPTLKNPSSEHWQRTFRIFDLLL